MIIATLLAGAALQAAALPPASPAPLEPPAVSATPLPPSPPLPPLPPRAAHDDSQVMSFDSDGRHVTIIKRRSGETGPTVAGRSNNVLTYKDGAGRDVTVFSDKPLPPADAERMERDMRARIPEITAKAMADARADAEVYRRDALRYGADARRQAEDARHQGEIARKEGEKAREYAQVIVKRMHDQNGAWTFDGGPDIAMFRHGDFAGPADLKALRDEVHALREEVEALRAQLKGGPSR